MDAHLLIAVLWGIGGCLAAWLVLDEMAPGRIRVRMARFDMDAAHQGGGNWAFRPGHVARRVGLWIDRRWPTVSAPLGELVESSGLTGRVSSMDVLGWKSIAAALGVALGLLIMVRFGTAAIVVVAGIAAFGWVGPNIWLVAKREARLAGVERALPTFMDLLTLCLEGGMGLARALRFVCSHLPSAFTDEIKRVLADVDLGISRREAFDRMARRVPLEDVRLLIGAIIQAEELQASLVESMRTQSREIRLTRRRRAEADAARAPVKMIFPVLLFTLPALFIVVLGPAVIKMSEIFTRSAP